MTIFPVGAGSSDLSDERREEIIERLKQLPPSRRPPNPSRLVALCEHALQTYYDMAWPEFCPTNASEEERLAFYQATERYKAPLRRLLGAVKVINDMIDKDSGKVVGDPYRQAILSHISPFKIDDSFSTEILGELPSSIGAFRFCETALRTERLPLRGRQLEHLARAVYYFMRDNGMRTPAYGERNDKLSFTAHLIMVMADHFDVESNINDIHTYVRRYVKEFRSRTDDERGYGQDDFSQYWD